MKSKNFHNKIPGKWTAICLTGLGLAFSFPPFPFPFVSLFALVPLLLRWHSAEDARRFYLESFYAFLLLFAVTFSWPLNHPYPNTAAASLTGVLLIPMTMAAPFALGIPVRRRLGAAGGLLFGGAAWLTMEGFWLHSPIAMPGALLGHAFANQLYINQIADLAGVAGLSLWVLGSNLLILLLITSGNSVPKWVSLLVLLMLPLAYSSLVLTRPRPADAASSQYSIGLVQPGVASTAWSDVRDYGRVARMKALTDSLLAGNDIIRTIVWPETSLPVLSGRDDSVVKDLQAWLEPQRRALLTGAIVRSPSPDPATGYTNSALLITADSIQRYDKNRLVPFAERVPFERLTRNLLDLRVEAGGVAGYQPGRRQHALTYGEQAYGILICFESLFGDYGRRYSHRREHTSPPTLVALSNIGWWDTFRAPAQYISFSRLRAIETRRPLLINTVTGPSVAIDRYGRIEKRLGWMETGLLTATQPVDGTNTFYTRTGDWISLLNALLCLLLLIRCSPLAKPNPKP